MPALATFILESLDRLGGKYQIGIGVKHFTGQLEHFEPRLLTRGLHLHGVRSPGEYLHNR